MAGTSKFDGEEEEGEVCLRAGFCSLIFLPDIHVSCSNPFTNFESSPSFSVLYPLCYMRNNKFISSTANRKPIKLFEGQGAPFLNKLMLFSHMQSICG